MLNVLETLSLSNVLFGYRRYDDDLDDVEEEDHFEDVDDLEVSSAGKLKTIHDRLIDGHVRVA